jgi:hypothetical protein
MQTLDELTDLLYLKEKQIRLLLEQIELLLRILKQKDIELNLSN